MATPHLLLTLSLSLMTLSGCAAIRNIGQTDAPSWPWKSESICADLSSCTQPEAIKAFLTASEFCRSIHNYYESGGRVGDSMKTSASVLGTVAGVVLAPISTGNAAKAWAGVAGATNALQTNMGEVFSSTVAIKRMGSVRQAVKAGEDKYFSKTDKPNDQVAISIAMSNDCWSAASNADASLVKALVSGSGDADNSALAKQVEAAKKYADEAKAAAEKAQKNQQELD